MVQLAREEETCVLLVLRPCELVNIGFGWIIIIMVAGFMRGFILKPSNVPCGLEMSRLWLTDSRTQMLTIEFREFNSLLEYFKFLISILIALVRCIYILLTIDGHIHTYTHLFVAL